MSEVTIISYGKEDDEVYQVFLDGMPQCRNAGEEIEATPHWWLAQELYEELSGETAPDEPFNR